MVKPGYWCKKNTRRSMGQNRQILLYTDILIKVYRGNRFHKTILDQQVNNLATSSVTYIELLSGLKTRNSIIDLNKQMKACKLIHISETKSIKSLGIVVKYTSPNSIKIADSLIGASAIVNSLRLFTDNKKNYDFIKERRFYR
ncbi:MAG: PIN domain-containing protein [Chitinophagaceae bacterium]